VPTGAQAVAGQFAQATLAALSLGFAKAAYRIPVVPTIVLNILLLVSANAMVTQPLRLGDMPWKRSSRDITTDLMHKTTLAIAATTLGRRSRGDAPCCRLSQSRTSTRTIYPPVLDLADDSVAVAVTCRVLGFSTQAFYKWRKLF
jgi:hypothetical protein